MIDLSVLNIYDIVRVLAFGQRAILRRIGGTVGRVDDPSCFLPRAASGLSLPRGRSGERTKPVQVPRVLVGGDLDRFIP